MQIKNLFFTLFLSLLASSCLLNRKTYIQNVETISKSEMLADFDLFQHIFEASNAGIYKYHSKLKVDSIFSVNRTKISDETTYQEFYTLVWNVIDFTGSCHNSLYFPWKFDGAIEKDKVFFPLPLKIVDGHLMINCTTKNIPLGSKIISINGINTIDFITTVSRYSSTDGTNVTGKHSALKTDWLPFYIYLAYGKQASFDVKFINNESIQTINVPSETYRKIRLKYKKRHSKVYEEALKESDYSFKNIDSIQTGILTIRTFSMGGRESDGHVAYAAFLDTTFTQLSTLGIKTLIVDVRGNGGGDDPNDLLLYSYLTKRNFKENTSAFTLFNDVPYPKHYANGNPKELAEELKDEHAIFKNGKYYQIDRYNQVWNPKKNAFKGQIILLIDSYVASAGSLFAAMIKSDEEPLVIGEETAGGYYGHTGHIPVMYQLPKSKLILRFSIVNIEQDVVKLPDEGLSRGIQPDIRIIQSIEDYINNKDTQLNYALQLCGEK